MSEYDTEPVRGLPQLPPDDERVLWQGSPHGPSVARRTLLGGLIAAYFALLAASVVASAFINGSTPAEAILGSLHYAVFGAAALALIGLIGWLVQKTTVYTITSRRIVMRIGIALPVTLNIPFSKIASADVKLHANGTGDISLLPAEDMPLTYFHMWPHVRGLTLKQPQPALRCVPEAQAVSDFLVRAMLTAGVKGHVRSAAAAVPAQVGINAPAGGMSATA